MGPGARRVGAGVGRGVARMIITLFATALGNPEAASALVTTPLCTSDCNCAVNAVGEREVGAEMA